MIVRRVLGFAVLGVVATAAGLLPGFLPQAALAEYEPACHPHRIATLDITYDPTGRPTVPVEVNGTPQMFLVDTGAMFGMLSWHTADQLGLNKKQLPEHVFYMMNGTSMEYISTVHDLEIGGIGGIPVDDQPFLVMPAKWSDPDVAGTLAPDTLSRYDLDFDFGAQRMHLVAPNNCVGNVVTWTQEPHVTLPLRVDSDGKMHIVATLDGHSMDAILDTGSGPSVLRQDEADAVLGRPLDSSELVQRGTGVSNGWDAYRHAFHRLEIGELVVRDPDLLIMTDKLVQVREPEEITKGFRLVGMQAPPLIIGMNVLRRLHMYVDYRANVVYATAADAH